MVYEFRPATPADWPAMQALLAECQLPQDGVQTHLATFTLAVQGQALMGMAGLEVYPPHALLRSVAVAAHGRGQGLGHQLTAHCLAQARAWQLHSVVLLTETAQAFFPRFGFQSISRAVTPSAVQQSVEFQGACPDSACVMQLVLQP